MKLFVRKIRPLTALPFLVSPNIRIGHVKLSREMGISILVVEQFLDFARAVADHFYIMETGEIVEHGEIDTFSDEIAQKYLSV